MASQTFNDTRIDQSVGMLLLAFVITGFFIMAVLGMQSVQNNAKSVAEEPLKDAVAEPVYDLEADRT